MSHEERGRPIEILLVEDNPGDVRLTIEALREGKVLNRLTVARDGEEAMAALRRQGRFANARRPDIILLDLNLPKKDGREVPRNREGPERWLSLTVIHDVARRTGCPEELQAHANCHITAGGSAPVPGRGEGDRGFLVTVVVLPKKKE
jgi:CheY-like chemotaxis protein